MFKKLKKNLMEHKEKIKFLSDFDLYGDYDDLLDELVDTKVMVLDEFDYDHRDLNKRFVDLCVEAGVKKVYYLQKFANDSKVSEEQSQLESYMQEYPGLDASFISLPLSMEKLYSKVMNHEKIPRKNFSVIANKDIEKILRKIILIEDNNKETYEIKGLSFDDVHNYHASFDAEKEIPMNEFKSGLYDFQLITWYEFVQSKKQA